MRAVPGNAYAALATLLFIVASVCQECSAGNTPASSQTSSDGVDDIIARAARGRRQRPVGAQRPVASESDDSGASSESDGGDAASDSEYAPSEPDREDSETEKDEEAAMKMAMKRAPPASKRRRATADGAPAPANKRRRTTAGGQKAAPAPANKRRAGAQKSTASKKTPSARAADNVDRNVDDIANDDAAIPSAPPKRQRKRAAPAPRVIPSSRAVQFEDYEPRNKMSRKTSKNIIKLAGDSRQWLKGARGATEEQMMKPFENLDKEFIVGGYVFTDKSKAINYAHQGAIQMTEHANKRFPSLVQLHQTQRGSRTIGPVELKAPDAFRGVSYSERRHLWKAQIKVNKQLHTIGYFEHPIDAALAYQLVKDNSGRNSNFDVHELVTLENAVDLDYVKHCVHAILRKIYPGKYKQPPSGFEFPIIGR